MQDDRGDCPPVTTCHGVRRRSGGSKAWWTRMRTWRRCTVPWQASGTYLTTYVSRGLRVQAGRLPLCSLHCTFPPSNKQFPVLRQATPINLNHRRLHPSCQPIHLPPLLLFLLFYLPAAPPPCDCITTASFQSSSSITPVSTPQHYLTLSDVDQASTTCGRSI